MAAVVIFVVDVQEGMTGLDKIMAELLRKYNLKVILVANKADMPQHARGAGNFHRWVLAIRFAYPLRTRSIRQSFSNRFADR